MTQEQERKKGQNETKEQENWVVNEEESSTSEQSTSWFSQNRGTIISILGILLLVGLVYYFSGNNTQQPEKPVQESYYQRMVNAWNKFSNEEKALTGIFAAGLSAITWKKGWLSTVSEKISEWGVKLMKKEEASKYAESLKRKSKSVDGYIEGLETSTSSPKVTTNS